MDPQASHRRNVLFWLQLLLASLDEEVYRAIPGDRKSTRLNSSHGYISYAVFCLKKKIVHSAGHTVARPHQASSQMSRSLAPRHLLEPFTHCNAISTEPADQHMVHQFPTETHQQT